MFFFFLISDAIMKVVCGAPIIEKCDSTNIEDCDDITYMNKLNENLIQVHNDLPFESTKSEVNSSAEKCSSAAVAVVAAAARGLSKNGHAAAVQNNVWNSKEAEDEAKDNGAISTDDSGLESAASSWDKSVTEVKEHAFTKLEEELQHAREILKLRDEEVTRLSRIKDDMETEIQELTASLFQVAYIRVAYF